MPIPALVPWLLAMFGGSAIADAMQSPKDDIKKAPALDANQQQVSNNLSGLLNQNLGKPLEGYGGPLAAGTTGLQDQVSNGLMNLMANPAGSYGPALSQMLSGNPSYKVDSGATQQMFDQSVARPAIQQFQEITRPGIIEENVGNGTLWSSMRANAEAKAASDLESNLAGQKSQLLYQDELSRRDLAESGANRAAGLMPTALQNQSNIYQQAIQQGSIEQQIDQFGLTAAYQEWQRTRPENTPYLQMALNYLNTPTEMAYQPAQQTSTMASLVQLLAPLIGGMGQAAGQQMDWRKLILGQ